MFLTLFAGLVVNWFFWQLQGRNVSTNETKSTTFWKDPHWLGIDSRGHAKFG